MILSCVGCQQSQTEKVEKNNDLENKTLIEFESETTAGGQEMETKSEAGEDISQKDVIDDRKAGLDEVAQAILDNVLDVNYIRNGDFSNGVEEFGVFNMEGGECELVAGEGVATVSISSTGNARHSNQFYYDGFALKKGGVYELSFDVSASIPRRLEARLQLNGGDYRAYISKDIKVTEKMQSFTYTFEMLGEDDKAPRLCFNLGVPSDGATLELHDVTVDNISLKLKNADKIIETKEVDGTLACNVNQVGYLPEARKIVTVRTNEGEMAQTEFQVLNDKQEVVYTGKLGEAKVSNHSGELVCIGDFSEFKEDGVYTIQTGENKKSFSFKIGNDVYDEMLLDAFHMLYLQRCGIDLTEEYAGEFAHSACHTQEAIIYGTDKTKDVSGGWHDAGDFGRYVAPGVQAAYDLILLYEDFPTLWGSADDLNIPESGNGVPDVLDEARYEIEWLLKMQDEETGGVYHKVTTKAFPGTIMPQNDRADLYLSPISTTATGDFAAIMAKSSIVYREYDVAFADECLEASLAAWDYLEKTTSDTGFKNPADISTGEYPDSEDKDERFWASVELYKATKEQSYLDYAHESMEKGILFGYGWAVMGGYGNLAYNSLDAGVQNAELYQNMKDMFVKKADKLVQNAMEDGYQNCLGDDYVWGSNMVVCNNAREMLFANKLTGDEKYLDYAQDQLHYLLGRNAVSYCFVTEFGTQSPKNTHHRPSTALGVTLKGMLVGGPNGGLEDPYAKTVMQGLPPAKCYIDNEQSYSVNEVTIYWNSPFIYLLSSQMTK